MTGFSDFNLKRSIDFGYFNSFLAFLISCSVELSMKKGPGLGLFGLWDLVDIS